MTSEMARYDPGSARHTISCRSPRDTSRSISTSTMPNKAVTVSYPAHKPECSCDLRAGYDALPVLEPRFQEWALATISTCTYEPMENIDEDASVPAAVGYALSRP
jgi:hypothetical protein